MKPQHGLVYALLAVACAIVALAGSYVLVRAFAASTEQLSLGTMRIEVEPARDGAVDVYVPIVDWGVRAEAFDAPLVLGLRFRSLDRDAASAALSSGTNARASLERLRTEVADAARGALVRAALLAVLGGVVGGVLSGGLVGAARRQRRWIGYGAAVGFAVPAAIAGVALSQVQAIDYTAFQRPTFYAHGRELPRLLTLSEQLLTAEASYTESYERALAGLANLVAFAGQPAGVPEVTQTALVASDLHANTIVLPVLDEYAEGKPLFFVGDFVVLGTSYELGIAEDIADLGDPVVAVSGNHDSGPFMRALAAAGAVVLTRDGRLRPDGSTGGDAVVDIGGLAVAGYDDPLEAEDETVGRDLELTGPAFGEAAQEFVAWFEELEERPDVVLVHQHGLAHALLRSLPEEPGDQLLILTGHDHEQHVEQRGSAMLIDGGTVGAGGPFAIGETPVGFAELRLAGAGLEAVDLVAVEPLSGEARAERVVPDVPAVAEAGA